MRYRLPVLVRAFAALALGALPARGLAFAPVLALAPVPIVFDTDIGNDIDDALAIAVLHELADRGEAEILAITLCKDNPWAAVHVDLLNTFYGRPDIPIGAVRDGRTPADGSFLRSVCELKNSAGDWLFPRDLESGSDAPEAVGLLRRTLAGRPDGSVVMVSVGFMTNFARLLDSPPDDASPMSGEDLVRAKVRLYVQMAGAFSAKRAPEYNVHVDAEASRVVYERWPTPLIASGYEIGEAILYPASSIEKDFAWAPAHPVVEGYRRYMDFPYDRQTWDLTAVLHAVRPDHGYFGLSHPGEIRLGEKSVTLFEERAAGRRRFLTASPEQVARAREALIQMASSPPGR